MTDHPTRLSRFQRVHSSSSIPSSTFTALTSTRSSSMTRTRPTSTQGPDLTASDWPFDTSYSERGFERDPFEEGRLDSTGVTVGSRKFLGQGVVPLDQDDSYWTRLGARATSFAGWTEGEGRVREWSKSWTTGGVSDDEDEEERDGGEFLSLAVDKQKHARPAMERQHSLSVFHDPFEHEMESTSTPSSRAPSRLHSLTSLSTYSTPSSPALRLSPLPPLSPLVSSSALPSTTEVPASAEDLDLDTLAHTFLATQDRFGLFALVESLLEWPWKNPAESLVAPSLPPTPALSRIASSYSLSPTSSSPDSPALERDLDWGGGGELGAYYRARSVGDLAKKSAWDQGERGEGEPREVRDGLGVVMDVLAGLGSFI